MREKERRTERDMRKQKKGTEKQEYEEAAKIKRGARMKWVENAEYIILRKKMNHSADGISTAECDGRAAICRSRRADRTDAARGRDTETGRALDEKNRKGKNEGERGKREKSPMNWRVL